MGESTSVHPPDTKELLNRAGWGDQGALGELLSRCRDRICRMVRLRLDGRLQGKLDLSDILQEILAEAKQRFPEYQPLRGISFFVWFRALAGGKLADLHRRHLGDRASTACRELRIYHGAFPEASSEALAALLMGGITARSGEAVRTERRMRLQEALDRMPLIDREILALRHFEQLTNTEAAEVLSLDASVASKRHLEALQHLKNILMDRDER